MWCLVDWIAFSSCVPSPFISCYAVSLKGPVLSLHSVCLCWSPQQSFSFSWLLSALCYGLVNTHLSGNQPVHFLLHIQRCLWIYLPSSSETSLANSYFQAESRSVTQISCSLPMLSQDCLWLKTWVGQENRTQPCSRTSLGRAPRQCRVEPWVAPSKKAAGVRRMSYQMICVPFPEQMLMSGFCGDILQRKLPVPGDAASCYMLASTSEPLIQNLHPRSQNLPFSTSSSNLSYISLQMAWGWRFHFAATSTALVQGEKKNSFECVCKTRVVSERPFSSQHILWVGKEADNWGSSPFFA